MYVTITEAADATGLDHHTIRGRARRGTIRIRREIRGQGYHRTTLVVHLADAEAYADCLRPDRVVPVGVTDAIRIREACEISGRARGVIYEWIHHGEIRAWRGDVPHSPMWMSTGDVIARSDRARKMGRRAAVRAAVRAAAAD